MLPVEFEPALPEIEQPKTHALDHAATGVGRKYLFWNMIL